MIKDNDEEGYSLPITDDDKKFAQKLLSLPKFKIPPDLLYYMIINFRTSRSKHFVLPDDTEIEKQQAIYSKRTQILENQIEEIQFKTSNGTFNIDRKDYHYKYFVRVVEQMMKDYQRLLPLSIEKQREWLIDGEVYYLFTLLNEHTSLRAYTRNVIIGLFMVHFEIERGRILMAERQWNNNRTSDVDYHHYLDKHVKSRLKRILRRFNSQTNDIQGD